MHFSEKCLIIPSVVASWARSGLSGLTMRTMGRSCINGWAKQGSWDSLPLMPYWTRFPESISSCWSVPRRDPILSKLVNKSALNPLLFPICEKHGVTLVSVNGSASADAIKAFCQRGNGPTIILCLSDLSSDSAFFCRDLAARIAESTPPGSLADTRLKCIGLKPDQVLELKIPMVQGRADSKETPNLFKMYLKPHSLDPGKMAELDALEVYYPGGITGFRDKSLSKYDCNFNPDNESWLLDPRKGLLPEAEGTDV
jgi:hypothetical protein